MGNFVSTVYSDWLITEKVARVFEENKLTGYKLREVDVGGLEINTKLWELVVTGKGGEAHPKSKIKRKYYCKHCGHMIYSALRTGIGIIVDEKNWDGSDFFTITAYPNYALINERVKQIIEENNLKGVFFTPTNELKRNIYLAGDEVSCA